MVDFNVTTSPHIDTQTGSINHLPESSPENIKSLTQTTNLNTSHVGNPPTNPESLKTTAQKQSFKELVALFSVSLKSRITRNLKLV